MKTLHFIFAIGFYVLCLITTGCSKKPDGYWIEASASGTKIWLANYDSLAHYHWEGATFDSVAHGVGILTVTKHGAVVRRTQTRAYYGAMNDSGIVCIAANEQYVGDTEEDNFKGYGVFSKGKDLYVGHFHKGKPQGFLTLYRNKKKYYVGFWDNGSFHGQGTLYKEDGTVKTGEWEHGKLTQTLIDAQLKQGHYKGYVKHSQPDGIGMMQYSNGAEYQGGWKQGLYHGQGYLYQGKDSILGTWDKGKLNGDALVKTSTFVYDGGFVDNIPTGIGILTTADGSYYSGSWLDGKRNGIGEMYFPNGDSYSGAWENNEFHGIGKFSYTNVGAYYEGEWKKGLQDGKGRFVAPGFSYNGEWEKGWMDGEGILSFSNGDHYEGTLHENKIDGAGCYEFANGNRYEGEFVEGKMAGNGIFQFKDGNRFEGEFYDNKIYGDGTLLLKTASGTVAITGFWPLKGKFPKEGSILFENGDLYEGPLNNGVPTDKGTWVSGKERIAKINKVKNSTLHKANELYKKHKATIDKCLFIASALVTAVEVACPAVAPVAHVVNMGINAVDVGLSVGSAALDSHEARELGEDASEADKRLMMEAGMAAAQIIVPKVCAKVAKPLGKAVKGVVRSSASLIGKGGSAVVKKSAFKFLKGKLCNRVCKLSISVQKGARKVEKALIQSESTRKLMIATGRLFTRLKDQTVSFGAYIDQIKRNPELLKRLNLSGEGSSKVLEKNMKEVGLSKWIYKNERIKRYLGLKRQVEAHHIIPSNPITESSKKAKEIWTEYFGSVDHPCNGIWLGRSNKTSGYVFLAKGSNHGPNTREYEEFVGKMVNETYNKYKHQYAKNPDMMRKVLGETVDMLKQNLYTGELAIGGASHQVHTVLSIFKNSGKAIREGAKPIQQLFIQATQPQVKKLCA